MKTYPIPRTPGDTAWSVFTDVVEHLRSQQGPAWSIETCECVNRTDDGRACAVACLLSDEELEEMSRVWRADSWLSLPETVRKSHRLGKHAPILDALQRAHDQAARAEAERKGSGLALINRRLAAISEIFNLGRDNGNGALYAPLTEWSLPEDNHVATED